MNEIVNAITKVSSIVAEITATAADQSQGIDLVNSAITELDQVTQQNAALVEQSAAAAESLRSQTQNLVQAMAVFKVVDVAALQLV